MRAVGVGVAGERLEQARVESDQRAPLAMLELGVEGARHVAENGAVEDRRTANVAVTADERAGSQFLIGCARNLRRIEADVALGLGQQAVARRMEVERRSTGALNQESSHIGVAAPVAAVGGDACPDLSGGR